jgi:hypothetical protein
MAEGVGFEAKADVFAVVREWYEWIANKGEYVGRVLSQWRASSED